MRIRTIYFLLISLITLLLGMIFWYHRNRMNQMVPSQLFVVCTTSIIADTVRQIGGELICVRQLMGPGVDPHLYRATENDLYALSNADIIFFNGLHLEGKMAEILEKMDQYVPAIAVGEVIPKSQLLESEFKEIYDPHIWHDVSLWIRVVDYIATALCHHDEQHAIYYRQRADEYMHKLDELDNDVRTRLAAIPRLRRILVTAHDAFSYFGRAYNIEVVGLQGMNTDAQISTKDIQNLAGFIAQYEVPALFLESSIPERNSVAVQQAVQSRGWHVCIAPEIFSDALGDQTTTATTYHGMIQHNIETIIAALS